ncbi:MAG: hypothetical protein Kow0056_11920 [Coriobacteriia bacterium]
MSLTDHVVHKTIPSRMLAASLVLALALPAAGLAFPADFFEPDASGNATYEAMVIQPEALYDPVADATYIAYQGLALDPYVITFDHATQEWSEPVRVGSNPLASKRDYHGGPALAMDGAGYLHIFWGAHGGNIRHSRSAFPHDASDWDFMGNVQADGAPVYGTYPQPIVFSDGSMRLFFRRTQYEYFPGTSFLIGGEWHMSWGSVLATQPSSPSGVSWGPFEPLIYGMSDDATNTPGGDAIEFDGYYVSFSKGVTDTVHAAFLHQDWDAYKSPWPYEWGKWTWRRYDLFYAYMDSAGVLRTVTGTPIPQVRDHARFDGAKVVESGDAFVNSIVVRDDGEGRPVILYLTGPDQFPSWSFARWTGSQWATGTIAQTDHLFDAGDVSVTDSQTIDAYIARGTTTTGTAGTDSARGGHMERWRTTDGGASWSLDTTILASPDAAHRYNDPQVVRDGLGQGLRIVFSEWNNDASNFISKVYLWGEPGTLSPDGFVERRFTPEVERLYGPDRIETAVRISQEAFPAGTDTVVVANMSSFPDALCGVPLASALKAPVLLVGADSLTQSVRDEIGRLGAKRAVVLGGPRVVGDAVVDSLRSMGLSVSREYGQNRYATSRAVAQRLRDELGGVDNAVFASGETFPDALSVSPVAAENGWPIILVGQSRLVTDTVSAYNGLGIDSAVFVGGDGAISPAVRQELIARTTLDPAKVKRLEGTDRYETAYQVGRYSLRHGLSDERLVMATGEEFADALAGGVLAERKNAIMLITRPHELSTPTRRVLLDEWTWNVLRAYVLGGPNAIQPAAENALASYLMTHQDAD